MKHLTKTVSLETKKQFEILNITQYLESALAESGVLSGTCVVFCPHTTASVALNHNEPLLIQDIMKTLYRLVPVDASYSHDLFELRQNIAVNERSNGHAHIKSFLLGGSVTLIANDGKFLLGAKQSVLFAEFDGGRSRQFHIHIQGE